MRHFSFTLLILVSVLVTLTSCASTRPSSTAAEFVASTQVMDGVLRVEHDEVEQSVHVQLDPSIGPAQLQSLSDEIFTLRTEHEYDDLDEVALVIGVFTAPLGDVNDAPGTPQPTAPDLGALPLLQERTDVVSGTIENTSYSVVLQPAADAWAWTLAVTADGLQLPQGPYQLAVSPTEGETSYRVALGDVEVEAELRRLATLLAELPTELTSAEVVRPGRDAGVEVTVDLQVAQLADADTVGDAFTTEYGVTALEDEQVVLGIETADGFSLRPVRNVEAYQELAAQLHGSGVKLVSANPERDSLSLDAADGQALRRVVELMGEPTWPLSNETSVSVAPAARESATSRATAAGWSEQVATLASLWEAGVSDVRLHPGRGEEDYDISIASVPGADITQDPARATLITIMREQPLPGRTAIHIAEGDHLRFTTTATGKAEDAYMSRHGADRTPSGWAADFLAAWDATAI